MNAFIRKRLMVFRKNAGFTLIELLAVIVVGGVLLAALTGFYLSEQRALRQQQIQIETSQALRVALEQVVRDLRAAGRNPEGKSGIGLTYADAREVRFNLDKDWDGLIDANDPEETKGFRLNGTQLQTYVAGSGGLSPYLPLADFMVPGQTVFRYYRADDTEVTGVLSATDLAAIRRIDVSLQVENRVPGAPDIDRTEVASVHLRNLE